MSYLSIRDLSLKGKRVFIRVDFNVPLQKNEQGVMEITSDKRIKASLPTIQYALDHGAGLILASHLGRPKGKPNAEMSLQPVAARPAKSCCWKICGSTPRRRRTTPRSPRSWPPCATSTSTTRSAPHIARMPPRRAVSYTHLTLP